jgi:hypothetical protein
MRCAEVAGSFPQGSSVRTSVDSLMPRIQG